MSKKNEYRCTRQALYQHDCIGRDNTRVRQGYYIEADDEADAIDEMVCLFPKECKVGFTVQRYSPDVGPLMIWTADEGLRVAGGDLKGHHLMHRIEITEAEREFLCDLLNDYQDRCWDVLDEDEELTLLLIGLQDKVSG